MTDKFIVPTLLNGLDGVRLSSGLLFKLPPDLGGSAKIQSYIRQRKIGWHRIDFGYWMFVHQSEELGLVRFVGLSTNDTRPEKDLGVRHPFSKQDFERYVESVVEGERQMRGRVEEELSLLIHDLRRFSNSIYQNAVATKKAIFDGNGVEAGTRIENTLAAQAMLSIRTDILDMAESRDIQLDESKVPVYRKFDKVVKSFQPGCNLKAINIAISGSSHSFVRGPDCMEIIAYILADNALKYSPSNSEIQVKVGETDEAVEISITSLGPVIESDEFGAIFEKGFRSRAAKAVETNGTGYGLYLAKSLVDRFKGRISAEQAGDVVKTSKGLCRDTTFSLISPIMEKRDRPVHSHLEKKGPAGKLTASRPANNRQSAKNVDPAISARKNDNVTGEQQRKQKRRRKRRPGPKTIDKLT